MKNFFLMLLVIPSFLLGKNLFYEKLMEGVPGDYVVYQYNKTASILVIKSKENDVFTIEEFCLPSKKTGSFNWRELIQAKVPSHTSWIEYTIDMKTKKIVNCFSYDHQKQISITNEDSLLLQLMHLEFHYLPNEKRKKIGLAPENNDLDTRQLWQPPLCYKGKKITKPNPKVYRTIWPPDDTPLSNKYVDCYFSKEKTPFPYWIQLNDESGSSFHIRGIEIGSINN